MRKDGVLFHAKYAFMPNSLGYCGPDERGGIQRSLEQGEVDDGLVRTLRQFEAAYPFLNLIAKSSGRETFDYSVPEAYWIGNSLLTRVPISDFYNFSHHDLPGKDARSVREIFRATGGAALPHHTFYVMTTYAMSGAADGPNLDNAREKVGQLVDSCRISWGKVKRVKKDELQVEYRPIKLAGDRMELAGLRSRVVRYNPSVRPFDSVKEGDAVSLHWDYACDVLSPRQLRNVAKYTSRDIQVLNGLLAARSRRVRR